MPANTQACKDTKDAKEMMELLGEQTPGFWKKFLYLVSKKAGEEPKRERKYTTGKTKKMTEKEALRFEKEQMPSRFTAQAGKRVAFVPVEYIAMLTDPDDFLEQLKRYTLSDRFKERLRRDEE